MFSKANQYNKLLIQQIKIAFIFGLFGLIISILFEFEVLRLTSALFFFGLFISVLYYKKSGFGEGYTILTTGIGAKIIALWYLVVGMALLTGQI